MTDIPELKPCPFCAGEAAWGSSGVGTFVHCDKMCCETASHGSIEKASIAWNTRAKGFAELGDLVTVTENNGNRNVIITRATNDLDEIINNHDPEIDVPIKDGVWDRLDKMAVEIEGWNRRVNPTYEQGVTAGFDEAIYEVKRGEIDPQTYERKS